jgi:broad specificity phosphatase PhoE
LSIVYYLSHPEVDIAPAVPVPAWGLSLLGRERVLAVREAPWLRACGRIVTSAERKAVETADLIAAASGAQVEVRPGMHENDRSATGFLPPAEFEAVADRFFAAPEASVRGWERAVDAQQRIVSEFDAVLAGHDHATSLLVVGHGGVGTLLYCRLAGQPIDRRFDQSRAGSVFAVELARRRPLLGWTPMEALAARLAEA